MSHRFHTHLIRRQYSYSVQEICDLLAVHKNTVREWLRNGLPKIDQQKPFLIYGSDLRLFLNNRQQSRLKKCGANEFYCMRCRTQRRSFGNLVDIKPRNAKTKTMRKYPTLEQIRQVIKAMPEHDDIAKRNRALVAFTILTGIRVQALASLKIRHIDLEKKLVTQDPREVKTKFSKIIHTYFFQLGDDLQEIVADWVKYLLEKKLFGYDAPLFPKTALRQDENLTFRADGIMPEHWTTTSPIREIFKDAFQAVGLPYYNPHSFRHTLGHLIPRYCKEIEQIQAWSQNLGHDSPITTYTSYGHMEPHRQGEIIKQLKG